MYADFPQLLRRFPRHHFSSRGGCKPRPNVPAWHVLGIHFENLLEDAHCLFEFAGSQEFIGDLQVLGPGVVEQALLGVELRELQHAIQAGLELGDFLVHRDAFDGKALGGVGITHALKARR